MRENFQPFRHAHSPEGSMPMKRPFALTALAVTGLFLAQLGCGEEKSSAKSGTTVQELTIEELKDGTRPAVNPGDVIEVHYTGWLQDGKKFDSSLDRGTPFPVTVGTGQVIRGWDQGLIGMKAGGKRKLIIPPDLAYGKEGRPPTIPRNAELTFEIELVRIFTVKSEDVKEGSGKAVKEGDQI